MRDDLHVGRADPDTQAIDRGYEARDLNIGVMIKLLAGFIVLMGILGGGLWWLYQFEVRHVASGEKRSAIDTAMISEGPPLQPQMGHESLDAWDLRKMRDQEDATFEKLGWPRDDTHHHFAVPASVVARLQQRQAATRPAGGGP